MKWSIRLKESANDYSWTSRRVWWVKQSEAERIIRGLRNQIKELKFSRNGKILDR